MKRRSCVTKRSKYVAKVKLKALERENRELRQANEILRKASAYFAQAELDRPFKR
jgi:transposase-like protein